MTFTRTALKGDRFIGVYRKGDEVYSVSANLEDGKPYAGLIVGPRHKVSFDPERHTVMAAAITEAAAAL